MKYKVALVCVAALAVPALTACIPTPDVNAASNAKAEGSACDANPLQKYIGKRFTASIAEQMRKEAGATSLRTGAKDSPVTMDYHSDRLNIFYDEAMLIAIINCG